MLRARLSYPLLGGSTLACASPSAQTAGTEAEPKQSFVVVSPKPAEGAYEREYVGKCTRCVGFGGREATFADHRARARPLERAPRRSGVSARAPEAAGQREQLVPVRFGALQKLEAVLHDRRSGDADKEALLDVAELIDDAAKKIERLESKDRK